jgi:predicted PurR-regulated permease PerM
MEVILTPEVVSITGHPAPPTERRMALVILATIGVVFALEWAQSFVISLLLGVLFAYTLNPLVVRLERIKIPRVLGTSIVMVGVVCALVMGACSLRGQLEALLDQVPAVADKLSAGLASMRKGQTSAMQKMQIAANQIEKATNGASMSKQSATRVVIDQSGFKLGAFLWENSVRAAVLIGVIPAWPHSRNWGYGPSGGLGLVVIILVVLLLLGRL